MKRLLLFSGASFIAGTGVYSMSTQWERDITVTKKYDKPMQFWSYNVEAVKMHIFEDENGKQYRVSINPWFKQFKPSELWNDLQEGQTYHLKGFGISLESFYLYETIYDAKLKM